MSLFIGGHCTWTQANWFRTLESLLSVFLGASFPSYANQLALNSWSKCFKWNYTHPHGRLMTFSGHLVWYFLQVMGQCISGRLKILRPSSKKYRYRARLGTNLFDSRCSTSCPLRYDMRRRSHDGFRGFTASLGNSVAP